MYPENLNQLIEALTHYFETASSNGKSWLEVLLSSPALIAAIGALAAFLPVYFTNLSNKRGKEKERIQSELNEFYNPLLFLLKRQEAIYSIFNLEAKKQGDVRTLELILSGASFSQEDMAHLNEIMAISEEIKQLVLEHPEYISKELMDPLVKLIEHYDLLKLATENQLTNREEYKRYVFPREINGIVEEKVNSLNEKLGKRKKKARA